jgi:hypothetical protein
MVAATRSDPLDTPRPYSDVIAHGAVAALAIGLLARARPDLLRSQ